MVEQMIKYNAICTFYFIIIALKSMEDLAHGMPKNGTESFLKNYLQLLICIMKMHVVFWLSMKKYF